jgi:hypothetical protein
MFGIAFLLWFEIVHLIHHSSVELLQIR